AISPNPNEQPVRPSTASSQRAPLNMRTFLISSHRSSVCSVRTPVREMLIRPHLTHLRASNASASRGQRAAVCCGMRGRKVVFLSVLSMKLVVVWWLLFRSAFRFGYPAWRGLAFVHGHDHNDAVI